MKIGVFDGIFDSTMQGLKNSLDLKLRRNEALTSNVANAETPGYRAVDVNFSTELERAFGGNQGGSDVALTNKKHLNTISDSGAHMIPDVSGVTRGDGNNVDLDIQMGKLAYNSGQYSTDSMLLRRKFQALKTAIREGGR